MPSSDEPTTDPRLGSFDRFVRRRTKDWNVPGAANPNGSPPHESAGDTQGAEV